MDNNVWALMRYLREDDTFTAAGAARETPAKGFPAAAGVSEMPAKGLLPAGASAAADTSAETGAGAGWPPLLALKIFLFLSCNSSARVKPSPGSCSRTQGSLLALLSMYTESLWLGATAAPGAWAETDAGTAWRLGIALKILLLLAACPQRMQPLPLGSGSTQSDLGTGPTG